MSIRLGAGEFDTPEGIISWGRFWFLQAVNDLVPEVFDDLRRSVLPTWLSKREFYVELRGWGERWNLDCDWIYEKAEQLLETWEHLVETNLDKLGELTLCEFHWIPKVMVPKLRGYDPRIETKAEFRNRVVEHENEIEEAVLNAGLERARHKDDSRHFEWLALYRVKGETAEKVGEDYGVAPHTIRKYTKELARLLGLPPRASGRQPKRSRSIPTPLN
jgi:hypothetical protein